MHSTQPARSHSTPAQRSARFVVLMVLAVILGALSVTSQAQAATGTGVDFGPDVPVNSFQASMSNSEGTDRSSGLIVWSAPGRSFQSIKYSGQRSTEFQIERNGTELVGSGTRRGLANGALARRTYPAAPDGYRQLDSNVPYLTTAGYLLARHREGTALLESDVVDGVSLLRGESPVAAIECAGLAAGTMTIWFDPTTLLPVSIKFVRGTYTQQLSYSYSSINRRYASSVFAFIPGRDRGAVNVVGQGFRRASVAKTDAMVPWRLKLPTSLPAGYARSALGYAAMSGRVGPEASIGPVRGYAAAVYSRGVESIDFTARRATKAAARDWLQSDPFAGECANITQSDATVNGKPAKFGTGPLSMPHLYWRDGSALYTLSGPYPKDELVRIADSVSPA